MSKEQRVKSREQRAKSKEQRAKSKEQRKTSLLGYIFPLLIATCSLLICIACQDPLSQTATIPAGKGSFSLSVNAARTILPTLDESKFVLYTLVFEPKSGGTKVETERSIDQLSDPVYLEPGTYNLVVTAYLDGGKPAARGSIEGLVINEGEITSQEILLRAIAGEGAGAFMYDVTFPADLATAGLTVTPLNAETGSQEKNINFLSGGGTYVTDTLSLNSGYYNVVCTLVKNNGETLIWRELLHIYANLESVLSIEFKDGDFYRTMYAVTFVFDNGDGNGEDSVIHGGKASIPNQDPTKDGHTFNGWYSDSGFSTAYDFATIVYNDFSLYAKWIEIEITLNETEISLTVGGTETLTATVLPSTVSQAVTWSSSDDAVASVSGGLVTAVGIGTATITAASVADNTVTATCAVTVTKKIGTGTELDPYLICDEADLLRIKKSQTGDWGIDKHYKLMDDITMTQNWTPIGSNSGVNAFSGSFDGGGNSIKGLTIDTTGQNKGLFGFIQGASSGIPSVIKNLALVNVNIKCTDANVGGVAGQIYDNAIVENCFVTGNVSGKIQVGGVVGYIAGGSSTVQNCYTTCDVSGEFYVGGVVGNLQSSTVKNCYSTGNVSAITTTNYVGGVVGNKSGGTLENCVALNKVINLTGTNNNTGRVTASLNGTLTNNFGRSDMQKNGALPNPAWTNDANGKDGADITSTNWSTQTWWSNTTNGPGFDFTSTWSFPDDKSLPILRGIDPSVQNPTVTGSDQPPPATTAEDAADFDGKAPDRTFTVSSQADWEAAIAAIKNGGNGKNYVITVTGDFDVTGTDFSDPTFDTASGIKVSLRGSGTLSLTGTGSMIRTGANQKVILRDLTLQGGNSGNSASVVYVNGADSAFVMHSGAITGNTSNTTTTNGGGVNVNNGTFTMHGGTISGNTANNGGGVFVSSNGTFTMHNGTISNNTASGGGGVRVGTNGTFRFVAGTIYGNENAVDESLRNNAPSGAALSNSGTAERGTFAADGITWIPAPTGNPLTTTNNTIKEP